MSIKETISLSIANRIIGAVERGGSTESILFVPSDPYLREISESMYLDGERPSIVNKLVMDFAAVKAKEAKKAFRQGIENEGEIRDSLRLDGSSETESERVIRDIRAFRGPLKKTPILDPYGGYRNVRI